MSRRLPPLNALRAFEAAARLLSISGAANELSVTHGAVSRHVSKLEQYLGAKLFQRDHQRLTLTPRGEAYAKSLASAFDQIQDATVAGFGTRTDRGPLRIGIYPTFANHVLIPRLARFKDIHPEIPFQIETSHTPMDPAGFEIDVAVRLGKGDWPDLVVEKLFREELIPVGSPRLLQGRPVGDPGELRRFTLLHAQPRPNDWEQWFKRAGVSAVDAHAGLLFEHSSLVYQAAVNGLGIAMAQTAHIDDHLRQGTLVQFYDLPLTTDRSYFLVYSPLRAKDRRIVAFAAWLKAEMNSFAGSQPSP